MDIIRKMSKTEKEKLCLEVKMDVLRRFASGEKQSKIAKILNLNPSMVRTICIRHINKIKIANFVFPNSKSVIRVSNPLWMKMENLLSMWIDHQNK